MTETWTVTCPVPGHHRGRGRRAARLSEGEPPRPVALGRVPRVARLLALAWRCEQMLHDGVVPSAAALARLGHITPARLSQIRNLLCLAPDIQEAILFLPPTRHGRDPLTVRQLQPLAAVQDWPTQRRLWAGLQAALTSPPDARRRRAARARPASAPGSAPSRRAPVGSSDPGRGTE